MNIRRVALVSFGRNLRQLLRGDNMAVCRPMPSTDVAPVNLCCRTKCACFVLAVLPRICVQWYAGYRRS
eukprot:3198260-Pyramimonas_sp.AAC.1